MAASKRYTLAESREREYRALLKAAPAVTSERQMMQPFLPPFRDRSYAPASAGPVAPAGAASPVGAGEALRPATLVARRALDVLVATVILGCLLPALLVVAALIKLDTPGPVLFRQRRLGKGLRPFTVLKFRTMHTDVTSDAHARYIAETA